MLEHLALATAGSPLRAGRIMAGEDPAYCAWIRSLPCSVFPCRNHSEPHHSTAVHKGMGQRAHDRDSMPLCRIHHHEFHAATGWCAGWSKDDRRRWQRGLVAYLRGRYVEPKSPASDDEPF